MPEQQWVTLIEVFDRIEGEIFKSALEARGIPSVLFQEAIGHYIYVFNTDTTPMGAVQVCVPQDRLEDAQAWLEEYQNRELEGETLELTDEELNNPGDE